MLSFKKHYLSVVRLVLLVVFASFFGLLAPAPLYAVTAEGLVERWGDVERSKERVQTLRNTIEVSAKKGLTDSSTHSVLVSGLDREMQQLTKRETELRRYLSKIEEIYAKAPEVIESDIEAAAAEYEADGYDLASGWLRDTIKILREEVVLSVQPLPIPEHYRQNHVAFVQRYLITYVDAQINIEDVNGIWDQKTEQGIGSAIRFIQQDSAWGVVTTTGAGLFSPELFIQAMRQHDQRIANGENDNSILDTGHFLNSLWALREQRVFVPEKFVVLADRLLAELTSAKKNRKWDFYDEDLLRRLYRGYSASPLYADAWPDNKSEDFLEQLSALSWKVFDQLVSTANISDSQIDKAFYFACLVEAMLESRSEIEPVAQAYLDREALRVIRDTLKASGFSVDGLWITDKWNTAMAVGLTAYLKHLQGTPALQWNGAQDGLFTQTFSNHFSQWVEALDPNNATAASLFSFKNAMTRLSQRGIYSASGASRMVQRHLRAKAEEERRQLAQQQQSQGWSENSNSVGSAGHSGGGVNWWKATLLLWANGFALEWGDEIISGFVNSNKGGYEAATFSSDAKAILDQATENGMVYSMIVMIIGRAMSLPGVLVIIWFSYKRQSKESEAFKLAFFAEAFEAIVSLIGEIATFGFGSVNIFVALFFLFVSTIITGASAAAVSSEPMGSSKRAAKIGGGEFLGVCLAIFLIYVTFIA